MPCFHHKIYCSCVSRWENVTQNFGHKSSLLKTCIPFVGLWQNFLLHALTGLLQTLQIRTTMVDPSFFYVSMYTKTTKFLYFGVSLLEGTLCAYTQRVPPFTESFYFSFTMVQLRRGSDNKDTCCTCPSFSSNVV